MIGIDKMEYLIIYIIIINFITFLSYGIDKWCAIKKRRRIRERRLLFYSLIGGFIGSLIGMHLFHHKTKKFKFYIINILAIMVWCGGIYGFRRFFT